MEDTRAVCDSVIGATLFSVSSEWTGAETMKNANNMMKQLAGKPLLAMCATIFMTAPAHSADSSSALFRARSGDFSVGTMRSVSVNPPKGWARVNTINQDPLSLAQWTPKDLACATGTASRLSLYAVDVGPLGAQKLMQKWFPDALKFHVSEQERGFVIVRAEAEPNRTQAVIAFPLSDQHITPLSGWIGGVNVLFVAESTVIPADKLEETVRQAIRSQIAVRTPNAKAMDKPFVLFNSKWHKSLADRLEEASKRGEPNALVSRAYSMFNDADGFVPVGQALLLKAAEKGHALAQLDLIRLSRRSLLTIEVPDAKLSQWSTSLATSGAEDARFWSMENRPWDEAESKVPGHDTVQKLAKCGQPEARRLWAKHLVQSFKAPDRFNGRNIVMALMRAPPLEGTLPITTRPPRAVEGPATDELKAAALLKTACPHEEDPEQDLFAGGDDFKIEKRKSKKSLKTEKVVSEADDFPELKEAALLDKMVNSGSMKTLKEAQKLACNWKGGVEDRNSIVVEIAARQNDGFGKWRRFRACDVIKENVMAGVCRDKEVTQAKLNAEMRYRDILVTVAPELRNPLANLRAKATTFQDTLLAQSYAVTKNVREKSELDRVRKQMETEFLDLVGATMNQNLQSDIRDVITGRRLLLLPTQEEEAMFTLKRQPASASFMKKELERLELRMKDTIASIEEADKEDINKEFKKSLMDAHEAWTAYRASYAAFAAKLGESGVNVAPLQAAADLWFHIEGIYYFEQIRDREINRADIPPEKESLAAN
ncbi:hypothetical protein BH10BDE1_BH10BDE1_22540 [soil metagenome]